MQHKVAVTERSSWVSLDKKKELISFPDIFNVSAISDWLTLRLSAMGMYSLDGWSVEIKLYVLGYG